MCRVIILKSGRNFKMSQMKLFGSRRSAARLAKTRTPKKKKPLKKLAIFLTVILCLEGLYFFAAYTTILQEELVRAGVLPKDYDFEAHKKLVPMQPGDVPVTYADTGALERDYGFKPNTDLRAGLRKFAEWYKEFYKV